MASTTDNEDEFDFFTTGFLFEPDPAQSSSPTKNHHIDSNDFEDEDPIERRSGDGTLRNAINYISSRYSPLLPVERSNDTITSLQTSQTTIQHQENEGYSGTVNMVKELKYRNFLVLLYMGNMTKCRGNNGKELYKQGAIDALLSLLNESSALLLNKIDSEKLLSNMQYRVLQSTVLDLITNILAAIRDLSCGNADNRMAVGTFTISYHDQCVTGIDVLISLMSRYHGLSWENILMWEYECTLSTTYLAASNNQNNEKGIINDGSSTQLEFSQRHDANDTHKEPFRERGKKELRLLTNCIGALRNITHSARSNCESLYHKGMVDLLVWRLKEGLCSDLDPTMKTRLPDSSKPWREGCYRIAGTLINISEKCHDCAAMIALDDDLIFLLLDAWGGAVVNIEGERKDTNTSREEQWKASSAAPTVHVGLLSILKERVSKPSTDANGRQSSPLLQIIGWVLEREEERYRLAQLREEDSKKKGET